MKIKPIPAGVILALTVGSAQAFNSGSTGADGAFSPTVNTELQLPPSGVFNFTSVNIPSGITVKFKKNALNTPVVILASGDVNIAGTIDIRGASGAATGGAGDGNVGDDGLPGKGGPGGYDGGAGGAVPRKDAAAGLGPGAGAGGAMQGCGPQYIGYPYGAAGSFGTAGGHSSSATTCWNTTGSVSLAIQPILAGSTYGSSNLVPLIGGSGGGGAVGGDTYPGSGGGGGGGAILIASSGTVSIASTGSILATGGAGGARSGDGTGSVGGPGSGGAIKIAATTIAGNGNLDANNGSGPAINGGDGRIRLEAENITRTAVSNPAHTFGTPGALFVAGSPKLRISNVAGVAAPAEPTGSADIVLPSTTPNPVMVAFQTEGVPVGNTVKLTVTPASGMAFSAVTPALTGTTASASASVAVTLPTGPSTLSATTTYTIVASLGDEMSRFAQGERVERVALTTSPGKPDVTELVTVSGKVYPAPPAALAMLATHSMAH